MTEHIKFFLNTKGDRSGISKELKLLLDYFDGKEPESKLAKKLIRKCLKPKEMTNGGESICHIRWN